MIRRVEDGLCPPMMDFLGRNVFGIKIFCDVLAYGTAHSFAEFWLQFDRDERIVAVIGRLDSALHLCIDPACDGESMSELRAFCTMLCGVRRVTVRADAPLGFSPLSRGWVMKLTRPTGEKKTNGISRLTPIQDIYDLLSRCRGAGVELPDYAGFYVDLSHRVRHGLARSWGILQDGRLLSVVMTTAETGKQALLGGVATDPGHRQKGFSGRLICTACRDLAAEGKEVYLWCTGQKMLPFYERLGFSRVCEWMTAAL